MRNDDVDLPVGAFLLRGAMRILIVGEGEVAMSLFKFLESSGVVPSMAKTVSEAAATFGQGIFGAAFFVVERGKEDFAEKSIADLETAFFPLPQKNVVAVVESSAAKIASPCYIAQENESWSNILPLISEIGRNLFLEKKLSTIRATVSHFLASAPSFFSFLQPEDIVENLLKYFTELCKCSDGFIQMNYSSDADGNDDSIMVYKGSGAYNLPVHRFFEILPLGIKKQMAQCRLSGNIAAGEDGVVFPMKGFNDNIFGVFFIGIKSMDADLFSLLELFVKQIASSINNAMMHRMLDRQSERLMRTNMKLNKNYLEVIQALREAVDAKDRYTHGHSERVSMYAVEIGKKFGLSAASIENLRVGGIFHDIGKIAVKDEILLKKSRLTDEEYEQVKIHPLKGAAILSGISSMREIVPIVEGHHENFDGTGYPHGLKGEAICVEARIMAIADAFDAMTSNREYHKKISFDEAVERIEKVRGRQFDPVIIDVFENLLATSRSKIQEISEFFGNEN